MDSSKKVFLSYRRALSIDLAGRIRDHLVARGYDVFFDVASIPSGKFGEIILGQIEARPLFVPVLVPGCLARTVKKEDWFRRELEHALAQKRHIVPLASKEFSFENERKRVKAALPQCIEDLAAYHYITAYAEYFEAAIEKLVAGLSAVPKDIVVRPTPPAEKKVVSALSKAAKVATPDALGKSWVLPPPFNNLFISLSAPKLTFHDSFLLRQLTWTAVDHASGYVLERSADSSFVPSAKIYDGGETQYAGPLSVLKGSTSYYRVKAKGVGIWTDSPWSNVVEVGATPSPFELKTPAILQKADDDPKLFGTLKYGTFVTDTLPAPKLRSSMTLTGHRLSWTGVLRADRYVLEKDHTGAFLSPKEVYSGKGTSFEEKYSSPSLKRYYRVRAIGLFGSAESPWSNVVEID